jgi:hypothetical protein
MITEQDILNDLTREFMPASDEEVEYLRAVASRVYKVFVNPLQVKLPMPIIPKQPEPKIEKRPGASWNNNEKRLRGTLEDMKKYHAGHIVNDNPHGWDK